jgi:seryl-tRNA synthetase
MHHVSKMDNMQKIDYLTKRSSELLADMRRLDKENQKNKRRGDALQKERDSSRTELNKTVILKEKLEKLCRELQRDNNKIKVGERWTMMRSLAHVETDELTVGRRTRTRNSKQRRSATARPGTKSTQQYSQS